MGRVGFGWPVILLIDTILVSNVLAAKKSYIPRQATKTSSSSPKASSTPILAFIDEESFRPFTCQPVVISWFYAGPRGSIDLIATNRGVPYNNPIPSPLSSSAIIPTNVVSSTTISTSIGRNIDSLSRNFTWASVNIPPGRYIINASMPAFSFSAVSDPFFVYIGQDRSCISSAFTSASSSSSPMAAYSVTPVSNPIGASSQSSGIEVILIACIGSAALLAFILTCCLFFIKRRKKQKGDHKKDRHHSNNVHRWNGLDSAESQGRFANVKTHRSGNDSIGTTLLHGSEEAAMAEKSSVHSKEQPSSFGEHDVALYILPVLTQQQPQKLPAEIDSPSYASPSTADGSLAANSPMPVRDLSETDALPSREYQESSAFLPDSAIKSRENSILRPQSSDEASPSTPQAGSYTTVDPVKQEHRQSLGRKRKPVPVYDPSLEYVSPSLSSAPPLPDSTLYASRPSPSPDLSHSSQPTANSVGHYIRRNHSIQDFGQSALANRNSLRAGSKPMHYLIPDMPLPQK